MGDGPGSAEAGVVVIGYIAAAWCGIAIALGLGIGKGIRAADRAQDGIHDGNDDDLCALIQPTPSGQDEVELQFRALMPGFVTADSFQLDAQMNRRARGAA